MPLVDGFPAVSGAADMLDIRKDLGGLVVRDTSGATRTGVFPFSTAAIVTGRSDDQVDIGAFFGVAERDGGAVFLANDGTAQATIPAAPGSGLLQYHVVYFKQHEDTIHAEDDDDLPHFGVLSGSASGFPTVPSLAAIDGAVELATVLRANGDATTADCVITQTHRYTAAPGGVVMCRDDTELQAWDAPDGSVANRLDSADLYRRRSGAWVNADVGSHGSCTRSTSQSIPDGFSGEDSTTQIVFNTPGPLQDVTYSTAGLTVLSSGTWIIDARLAFAPNATGYRYLYVKVNGAAVPGVGDIRLANGAAHSTGLGQMAFLELEAGDVLTLEVAQTRGAALNVNLGARLRLARFSETSIFTL